MRHRLSAVIAIAFLAASSAAHAICRIGEAGYEGGAFGAEAINLTRCFTDVVDGGTGHTSAALANVPAAGLRSSADLRSGVLTAYSSNGFASSSLWDTLTFSGLPAAGGMLTETLSVTGSMTGNANGSISLSAGQPFSADAVQQSWWLSAGNVPASVSVTFEAHNGVPIIIFASLFAAGSAGNVADLLDPPTLGITTPDGVTFTSASNQFLNVSPVPEPATYGLLLAGLGLMAVAQRRRQS